MHQKNQQVPDWLAKARTKWRYFGQERPPFAQEPRQGQRSVWDFPRPPALIPAHKKVEVRIDTKTLALSSNALELQETASPPTYYMPPEDISFERLIALPRRSSLCEWKGKAKYWALASFPDRAIAWSYPAPFEPYAELRDHLAFYPQYLDCFVNDERVVPQPGGFYAGWITKDLCGPFKGEPGTGHW